MFDITSREINLDKKLLISGNYKKKKVNNNDDYIQTNGNKYLVKSDEIEPYWFRRDVYYDIVR